MNLPKINNFAFTLALALGFAGASALSSLSVAQAQTQRYSYPQRYGYPTKRGQDKPQQRRGIVAEEMEEQSPFDQGIHWGRDDSQKGARFRPCEHQEYMKGSNIFRKNFVNGYSRGYFGGE